ncbi:MAG: restriction endonuclease [Deltaproteobacteria bacterium]|nr:restriction endonuclease [Deltaproteobacteria bacterium]
MENKTEQYLVFPESQDSNNPRSLLFQELLENGLAQKENRKILVPHEEICRLSSIDQKILELPDPYPFDIRIDASGILHESDMQLVLGFYEYNHGNQLFGECTGCILTLEDGTEYLLSPEQYRLSEAVEEFNAIQDRDFPASLIRFSEIKQLSKKSAAILDSYLEAENIFVPEKIGLKLSKTEDGNLEILPEIESSKKSDIQKQFETKFDTARNVRSSYTIKDEKNNRLRIPFSKKQQDELRKIKKYRRIVGNEKEKILQSPQEIFDPDVIDLNNFSDRVIKIGLYKPRYFPFISPYKSEWIPGIIIDSGNEKRKMLVPDKEELKDLQDAYEKADSEGSENIEWKGKKIPINNARGLINLSKEQFQNPKSPVKKTTDEKKDEKVLIIIDNIYDDKYQKHKKQPVPVPETFIHNFKKPPTLKREVRLYEHQREGIAWMESLSESNKYQGGLLADDMGLGKTLQILSFIDWHNANQNEEKKPYLIVAPVTLLENWQAEFRHFFDSDIEMSSVYGSRNNQITLNNLKRHAIFLTNYESVRTRRNHFIFGQIDWAVVVLDEAQKIKTPGTLVTNAIKALKADFKIAATGTPVENSMVDLWCITDFVVPGLLGSAKIFSEQYQKPIRKNISDHELNQLGQKLRSHVGLYFKRRLKKDILVDLPEKIELRKESLMLDYQRNTYLNAIQQGQAADRNEILSTITKLKKISDHPYHIEYNYQDKPSQELIETSAKLQATITILEQIKSNEEKAIIFAEFRKTQAILQKVVQHIFDLKHVSIINGEMAARKGRRSQKETRQEAIDRFQGKIGFNVIIMSPVAAGLGLNVTGANHVIHYSRHWNPAKESQATDRAHRIGQNKNVFVYYPMSVLNECKTFDVIIDNLLQQKRHLADAAMFPSAICEVDKEDFSEELSISVEAHYKEDVLKLEDFDQLEPTFFEAAIAAIYEKKGYQVTLTPKSNDKGADIVALSENRNYLIQVKQSKSPINGNSVGEVLKAKRYYEKIYNEQFYLKVATNNELNSNATMLANANHVAIFDRSGIQTFFKAEKLFLPEIHEIEDKRLARI